MLLNMDMLNILKERAKNYDDRKVYNALKNNKIDESVECINLYELELTQIPPNLHVLFPNTKELNLRGNKNLTLPDNFNLLFPYIKQLNLIDTGIQNLPGQKYNNLQCLLVDDDCFIINAQLFPNIRSVFIKSNDNKLSIKDGCIVETLSTQNNNRIFIYIYTKLNLLYNQLTNIDLPDLEN